MWLFEVCSETQNRHRNTNKPLLDKHVTQTHVKQRFTRWKLQNNMTGNAPPREVCLVPLKAWQSVSLPPLLPPQHVFTPHDIRQRASRRGHEFDGFIVWKKRWSLVWELCSDCPDGCNLGGHYPASRFRGARRTSAWHGWPSQVHLWSAVYLCAGQGEEGSRTCSTNPGQTKNKKKKRLKSISCISSTALTDFFSLILYDPVNVECLRINAEEAAGELRR